MTRLARVVSAIDGTASEGPLPYVALEHLDSGTGRLSAAELPERLPAPAGMVEVRQGDVVFGKLRPYLAKSWLVDRPALCSSELIPMRARPPVEPRWLSYLVQSRPFVEWGVATSDGTKMPRTSWEKLGRYEVDVPAADDQRAIADYLDAETTRIYNLVAARRRMAALIDERLDGEITTILDRSTWPVAPLKWLTRVTVGIVIRPSELYAASGVPCLRGLNVRPGVVNDSDLVYIGPEANATNSKSILRGGDVVVVRTGNAGAAAVVPDWAAGGNCVDLLIVRRSSSLDPRFLEAILNSAVVRRQVDEESVGALQAHFNTESLAALRLPAPDLGEQAKAMAAIDNARAGADGMRGALGRQIDVLLERRQALITAAVTGGLELPRVAA